MNWLEVAVWSIAIVAVVYNLYYDRRFSREEGMDERGQIIRGDSARLSFSIICLLISLLLLTDTFLQYSLQVYKLLVAVIMIVSNVISFVTLSRIRKNY
ncbi:hypothetical protein [Paenibacillus turpanensis]|uniref:hypothetical protein n=1 Tax=Paenibacillus turpanensis TaxID=2689078 RepID=UPI00140B8E95|nr:hypothetical protein [Paenibacillus turpanensis]